MKRYDTHACGIHVVVYMCVHMYLHTHVFAPPFWAHYILFRFLIMPNTMSAVNRYSGGSAELKPKEQGYGSVLT